MFLDNVTNRTIEISLGKIYDYPKPYTQYLILRNEIRTQQIASQKNQAKQIAQTEKLIDKFRAKASKATMAQSLIKKLDKVDRIEVDKDDNSVMKLSFPISINPGKVVIEANSKTKNYGDLSVLQNISLSVDRNSKIAFVGQNGQGKSTLAKIIVGDIKSEGVVKLGHNVQIGYFAQNQAEYLDGSKTVLDTMIDAANEKNRSKVRDILGSFLFKGDDAEKFVRVLSGGERNRLALAKLLLQPLNVLIMDEPTNHLDIKSKNVLKEALKKFEGTLLLVSHDRDFLQGLVNKVYEFKDKKINEYLGDIDYYLEEKKVENLREVELKTKIKVDKPINNKLTYNNQKKLKSLNNKLSKVESKIGVLENDIKDLDNKLEENYDKYAKEENFFDNYHVKKSDLNKFMKEWELIQNDLSSFSE
jgi:ATP-binding cassette subfamily F protein 3